MTGKKQQILLVEDEPSLVNLYKAVFKDHYAVQVAQNYEEANDYLENNNPDLVLLDVIIPSKKNTNLDYGQKVGLNLLKKTRNIPTIVLTNLDSPEDRKLAKKLGAIDFVVKANILPKDLIKKIQAVFNI